jgi:ADP-ribose pyrophosphatase YjhB (NUDIX family)
MAILYGWRTCPRCEGRLENDGARATCTGRCRSIYYANSAPCVSALVEDPAGRLLLARRAVEPFLGLWDPPGGFLEEGEHPVEGLRRELLEETGLDAEVGPFVGAWMDVYGGADEAAATLNLYWSVRMAAGDLRAADDVAELRWFEPDALPAGDELAFTTVKDALAAWRKLRAS